MKKLILILFITFALISLHSQEVIVDKSVITSVQAIDDLLESALIQNPEYQDAVIQLLSSTDQLDSGIDFRDSALSFNVDYDKQSSGTLGIHIPIIEQLNIEGSFNSSLDSKASINFQPFEHSSTAEVSRLNYEKSVLQLSITAYTVQYNTLSALLNWTYIKQAVELLDKEVAVAHTMYTDSLIKYDNGLITLDDVRSSLLDWSEAGEELISQKQKLTDAELQLHYMLGSLFDDNTFDLNILSDYLDKLMNSINVSELKAEAYLNAAVAAVDEALARVNLDDTWNYTPDLTASANIELSAAGELNWNTSLTFALSQNDFNTEGRDIKNKKLELAEQTTEYAYKNASLLYDQYLDGIDQAELTKSIAFVQLEQNKDLLKEAELLYTLGDISKLELESIELQYQQAENSLYFALQKEILAWFQLKQFR